MVVVVARSTDATSFAVIRKRTYRKEVGVKLVYLERFDELGAVWSTRGQEVPVGPMAPLSPRLALDEKSLSLEILFLMSLLVTVPFCMAEPVTTTAA